MFFENRVIIKKAKRTARDDIKEIDDVTEQMIVIINSWFDDKSVSLIIDYECWSKFLSWIIYELNYYVQ